MEKMKCGLITEITAKTYLRHSGQLSDGAEMTLFQGYERKQIGNCFKS